MQIRILVMPALVLAATISAVGLCMDLLVVKIGSPEVMVPVSEGDVLFLTCVNSMYRVPVSEKFRIEGEHLRLVHVQTQSDAVLAYLGIEKKDEPNVDGKFKEFSIPAASIGNHVLRFHDREIPLGTGEDREGTIYVKLAKVSILTYFARLVWR